MSDAMIIASDVHKSFRTVTALDGINIVVPKGQVLGLLGPNGAGKTTLVRLLTTLLRPDRGSLSVAGIDVEQHPAQVRKVIGLAGQYPAVDEELTGFENLQMIGRLYHLTRRDARSRAEELLTRFTLTDAARRPVKTYSGGMRRRLDLAASIVARPQVLFLDEPTTGLDPRTRKDLWNLIQELVADGTTLLLTTQYLEEADALADNIAVIDRGKVIAEGTSDELKAQLASDVVGIQLSNADHSVHAATVLKAVAADEIQINANAGVLTVPVDNGSRSLIAVVRKLDGENIDIDDISLRRPSLDDVFLTLTEGDYTPAASDDAMDIPQKYTA